MNVTLSRQRGEQLHFLFLNIGHFLDHLFMLVFATAAALVLIHDWQLSYSELIPYATPGFVAFAAFTIPSGWLADRWSRESMMVVFFLGIGVSSIATALAASPLQIAIGLFFIGVFASIYHPVGIAMVLEGRSKTGMRVASNGVWGNLGVAVAALLTGWLIDHAGWRAAFVLPGLFSVLLGLAYASWVRHYSPGLSVHQTDNTQGNNAQGNNAKPAGTSTVSSSTKALQLNFYRVLAVVLVTTACGGVVFQSTTFALPRILMEKGGGEFLSATQLGWLAFSIFAIGSIGQLVVGHLLDRGSVKPVFIGIAIMQVIFFFSTANAQGVFVPLLAAGFMLAAFGQIPINDVLVGKVASSQWRSRILAIRYALTLSAMALSVPMIAWVSANTGLSSLFLVLSGMALIILFATLFLPSRL